MFKFETFVTKNSYADFVISKTKMDGVHSFEHYPNTFDIYQRVTLRRTRLNLPFIQLKSMLLGSIPNNPPLIF